MNKILQIQDLPAPPTGKTGFPWTEGADTPPQYVGENLQKISIITPSFNQGQFLEETIRSVLLQGYPNLEYIVMDGGSTDNSVEIIKKYAKWLTYWVSEADNGQSHAINKGANQATGDLINWLNSDDLLAQNALWQLAVVYQSHPEASVFLGQIATLSVKKERNATRGSMKLYPQTTDTLAFSGMTQQALFYKVDTWKKLGGVREAFFFCMDLDVWWRYLCCFGQNQIVQSDHLFAHFRLHDLAKTTTHATRHDAEKIALFCSVLRALQIAHQKIKPFDVLTDFEISADWQTQHLNQQRFAAAAFYWLLDWHHSRLSFIDCLRLYFWTLAAHPFGRSWRVYILPLAIVQRYFLGKIILQ
jgi:hypothetical protein